MGPPFNGESDTMDGDRTTGGRRPPKSGFDAKKGKPEITPASDFCIISNYDSLKRKPLATERF